MRELSLKDNSGASLHLELGDLDTTERRQQYAEIVRIFLQVPEVEQVTSKNPPRQRTKQATPPEDGQSGTDTAESEDKGLRNDSSGSLIDQVFKIISREAWLNGKEIAKLCPSKPTNNSVRKVANRLIEDGKIIRQWQGSKHIFALPGTPEPENVSNESFLSQIEDVIKRLSDFKTGREIAEIMGLTKRYEIERVQTSAAELRNSGRIRGKKVGKVWRYSSFEELDIDEPKAEPVEQSAKNALSSETPTVAEFATVQTEPEQVVKESLTTEPPKPEPIVNDKPGLSRHAEIVKKTLVALGGKANHADICKHVSFEAIEVTRALKELKLAGFAELKNSLYLTYELTKKAA